MQAEPVTAAEADARNWRQNQDSSHKCDVRGVGHLGISPTLDSQGTSKKEEILEVVRVNTKT
jgi:hypothetical protein